MLLQALLEVLESGIVDILIIHVPFFKLLVVAHPLNELVSLGLNRADIFITRPLK